MKTKDRLVQALIEANAPAELVDKARTGYYDDFESELDCPNMQLAIDCREVGLQGFADRVVNGEFDATTAEAQAWLDRTTKGFTNP